jgi:SAM-dependent methyltransferase
MTAVCDLPTDFLRDLVEQEEAYLQHEDPIRQSGFGGGAERWRQEREPILDAVTGDGAILDVGCANGHLVECLASWGRERGFSLEPHGIDIGARLIGLAAEHLHVGNAWTWMPPQTYRYVYVLYDCVPEAKLAALLERLLNQAVAPGGRLIVGAYGSRSRGLAPFAIAEFLRAHGFAVRGTSAGGNPPVTAFAWIDAPPEREEA